MEVDIKEIINNIRIRKYKYLGSGSGRRVYDLNNGTVIKLARNKRGTAQNQAECQISAVDTTDLFAKVLYNSSDFTYIIMEKAHKVNISYVCRYFNVISIAQLKGIEKIKEAASKYNLLLSDLGRSANWGAIKGKPVIIDYGFTRYVKKKFY